MLTKNTALLREEGAKQIAHFVDVYDLEKISVTYGLPSALVGLCRSIFEGLPATEAKGFFAALSDAVGCDGKDLSRVVPAFLASELRALPRVPTETQAVVDTVIAGMDLLAGGGEWPRDDALAATLAAFWAAVQSGSPEEEFAARAAEAAANHALDATTMYGAEAANHALKASYTGATFRRQRDTLLKLISDVKPD